MKQNKLQAIIIFIFLALHFLIIILMVIGLLNDKLLKEQFSTVLGIVLPITTGNLTIITAWVIKHRRESSISKKKVSGIYATYSLLFIILFLLSYLFIVVSKVFSIIYIEFEQFKAILIIIESSVAIYIGKIISDLFKVEKE